MVLTACESTCMCIDLPVFKPKYSLATEVSSETILGSLLVRAAVAILVKVNSFSQAFKGQYLICN